MLTTLQKKSSSASKNDFDDTINDADNFPKKERKLIHFILSINNLKDSVKHVHTFLCDATYKLTYENYPIITGGTTDRNKNIYPVGIALTRQRTEAVKETYEKCNNRHKKIFVANSNNEIILPKDDNYLTCHV
ncbi:hypothetical protein BpHYR1_030043, partial [Brachionus plicatilis]